MLLLLFNRNASDPTAPVYSTNYGTLCLETTIFADELESSVLIGELSASALMGEVATTVHETTLSSVYSC
jgi:hypothetical protein